MVKTVDYLRDSDRFSELRSAAAQLPGGTSLPPLPTPTPAPMAELQVSASGTRQPISALGAGIGDFARVKTNESKAAEDAVDVLGEVPYVETMLKGAGKYVRANADKFKQTLSPKPTSESLLENPEALQKAKDFVTEKAASALENISVESASEVKDPINDPLLSSAFDRLVKDPSFTSPVDIASRFASGEAKNTARDIYEGKNFVLIVDGDDKPPKLVVADDLSAAELNEVSRSVQNSFFVDFANKVGLDVDLVALDILFDDFLSEFLMFIMLDLVLSSAESDADDLAKMSDRIILMLKEQEIAEESD